ncbi:MAG: hypothetical protein HUU20_27095 [Pirellulales bacterium]|nr:hypothetical protein [Pirellulales bacterium]
MMSTHLQSTVETWLGWTWRDTGGNAVVVDSNRLVYRQDLRDGQEPGEADVVWHDEGRLLAEGEALLLQLDALEQPLFGDTIEIAMERVKAILVVNRNLSGTAWLSVGGAPADEWCEPFGMFGDTVKAMPGSPLLLANVLDGWPVGTPGGTLRIAAVGGEVTFDIAILGTRAEEPASSGT